MLQGISEQKLKTAPPPPSSSPAPLFLYWKQRQTSIFIKGQMNQKIEIFSFAALPSSNTKKNHPKWDLGKDFSSQAFIER